MDTSVDVNVVVLGMMLGMVGFALMGYILMAYRTIGRLLETVREQNEKLERLAQSSLAYKGSSDVHPGLGPSVLGQAAGLLVPVFAYTALLVSALCLARGLPVGQSISIASPALVLCAALGTAIVLYAWTARRSRGLAAVAKSIDTPFEMG